MRCSRVRDAPKRNFWGKCNFGMVHVLYWQSKKLNDTVHKMFQCDGCTLKKFITEIEILELSMCYSGNYRNWRTLFSLVEWLRLGEISKWDVIVEWSMSYVGNNETGGSCQWMLF